jgi:iron complex outermembrane recepter protein
MDRLRPRSPKVAVMGLRVAAGLSLGAFTLSAAEPATELPSLTVRTTTLAPDDVTVRPFVAGQPVWSGRAIATLKDAIGLAPGLLIQDSFGGFEPPRLSLRGSGLQSAPSSRGVQFLLHGLPLNLTDGSFNTALIDPQLFDRVEIYRGESAARLAPAVMGGAFNLRPRGLHEPSRGSLRAEVGSFGALRLQAAGLTAPGSTRLIGSGSWSQQDGYREQSRQQRFGGLASLLQRSASGFDSSVSCYHVRAAYDVPGPMTLLAAENAPRSVSDAVRRDQPRRESELTQLAAQSSGPIGALHVQGGVSWLHSEDWFRQLRGNGLSDSRSHDLSFRGGILRPFESDAGEHQLQLETTVSRGWRELQRFEHDRTITGRRFSRDDLAATTAALDLAGTAQLPRNLDVSTGGGVLLVRRDVQDRMAAGGGMTALDERLHSVAWQPRAQARWQPTENLAWFVAVARTTEPPTFDDLLVVSGTPGQLSRRYQPLRHQRATTWELGTTGSHGTFGWDVTAYHGMWRDEILRLADAQGLPRGAVNAGPTRHRGVETAWHWQIWDDGEHQLHLTSTAIWSRFAFRHDPIRGNQRLAGAPPYLGAAQLTYQHRAGLFASSGLDWTAGRTLVDHAGRMSYGGYTRTHLRAGWRQRSRWTLFVDVQNVFDRRTIASTAGVLDLVRDPAATAVFLPGVGRALTLGFESQR